MELWMKTKQSPRTGLIHTCSYILLLYGITILILIPSTTAIVTLQPFSTPRDFTSDGVQYHPASSHAYYSVNQTMTFHPFQITPTSILLNTTILTIDNTRRINITLDYLHPHPTRANGTILQFYANTSSGTATISISGLTNRQNYEVYQDNIYYEKATATASGVITFTNNVWSEHYYTIKLWSISIDFTIRYSGNNVILTPILGSGITHYQWTITDGGTGQTGWIQANDQAAYVYTLIPGETYNCRLTGKNASETVSITKSLYLPHTEQDDVPPTGTQADTNETGEEGISGAKTRFNNPLEPIKGTPYSYLLVAAIIVGIVGIMIMRDRGEKVRLYLVGKKKKKKKK